MKHPGKTKAQQLALDEIGIGNSSPMMAKATKEALLKSGLIVKCGEKRFGSGALQVVVDEYEMPVQVHYDWTMFLSEEYDRRQAAQRKTETEAV